ncbi:MAG: hypothetical protein QOF78_2560, partial [Phycisphaerales bacterium]|nr:hypothetical protein [Phycisphaerales bacterium]
LVERDEKRLRALATGLADGETASDVLARHGTTWREFEDAWLAWGRQKFREDDDADAPVFAPPVEFR